MIFYIENNPKDIAKNFSYIQLSYQYKLGAIRLSTVHRLMDGLFVFENRNQKMLKHYALDDIDMEENLYRASENITKARDTKWIMKSKSNYEWYYNFWLGIKDEKQNRGINNKIKKQNLENHLVKFPKNMPDGKFSLPPFQEQKGYLKKLNIEMTDDPIENHRRYYVAKFHYFFSSRFVCHADKIPLSTWAEKIMKELNIKNVNNFRWSD